MTWSVVMEIYAKTESCWNLWNGRPGSTPGGWMAQRGEQGVASRPGRISPAVSRLKIRQGEPSRLSAAPVSLRLGAEWRAESRLIKDTFCSPSPPPARRRHKWLCGWLMINTEAIGAQCFYLFSSAATFRDSLNHEIPYSHVGNL